MFLLFLFIWTSGSSWRTAATGLLSVWGGRNCPGCGLLETHSPGLHWPPASWIWLNPIPAFIHTKTLLAYALYRKAAEGKYVTNQICNKPVYFWRFSCRTEITWVSDSGTLCAEAEIKCLHCYQVQKMFIFWAVVPVTLQNIHPLL